MNTLRGPPAETLALLIDDPAEHDHGSPTRLLAGLATEEAFTRLPSAPYTIAQLLAHARANTEFNLRQLTAENPGEIKPGELWPDVTPEQLPELITGFLNDLQALARLARDADLDRVIYSAVEGNRPGRWGTSWRLAWRSTPVITWGRSRCCGS